MVGVCMSRRGRGLRWVVPVGFSWVRVSGTPSTHVQQELPSRHLSAGHQRHRSPALGDSNNCVPGPSPGVRLLGSVSWGPSPWVRQLSGLCGLVPLMVAPSLQLQLPGGLYESPCVFLDD